MLYSNGGVVGIEGRGVLVAAGTFEEMAWYGGGASSFASF